jgi:hypothetical protein
MFNKCKFNVQKFNSNERIAAILGNIREVLRVLSLTNQSLLTKSTINQSLLTKSTIDLELEQ